MTEVVARAPKPSFQAAAKRDVARYIVAPVTIALAIGAKLALSPIASDESVYLILVPAVLAAAGLGGLGPGLAATVLGLLFVVLTAQSRLGASDIANAAIFAAIGAGVSWIGGALRQNRVRATASTQDALSREAHLRSILETIPDAMIVIDERGAMQSFSTAAARLFGYSADEVLGKNVRC
jgi:two-component system sensor kinase FixL